MAGTKRRIAVAAVPSLILMLMACSPSQPAPGADDATATVPAAAATLQPTPPMVPAATTAAMPGRDNLCAPGEKVIFSCHVAGAKMLSVCAAAEEGGPRFAQYRFGVPGEASELTYPEQRAGGALRFVSVPYSGGGEAQLSFERGGATYVVYSRVIRTNFEAGEPNNPAFEDGVMVLKDGRAIADRRCQPEGLQSIDYDLAERYAKKDDGGDIIYPDEPAG